VYRLGGGVAPAEWGKEAKKSLFRERVDAWEGDLRGGEGGLGRAVENGEEKKAWVLLTGGGVRRASGDTSEKPEEDSSDRELVGLRGDEVDEEVERDSSGRVVAGDHCIVDGSTRHTGCYMTC
jgi:hypothetical protein